MAYQVEINGEVRDLDVPGEMPLLWALRNELGMVGTKFGCGMALCGACTVHIDGVAARSCTTPVSALAGKKVTTIEALAESPIGRALQQAWLDEDVMQCGYCQAGQLMNASALLARNPQPSSEQIEQAMAGNICRCACYTRIHDAIAMVAARPMPMPSRKKPSRPSGMSAVASTARSMTIEMMGMVARLVNRPSEATCWKCQAE